MCGFGVQTQKSQEVDRSIYSGGCADRAVKWMEAHLLLVGALTLGLALPQVTSSLIHLRFRNKRSSLVLNKPQRVNERIDGGLLGGAASNQPIERSFYLTGWMLRSSSFSNTSSICSEAAADFFFLRIFENLLIQGEISAL